MKSRLASRPGGDLEQVVIEVTGRCNHQCPHCYNFWPRNQDRLDGGGEMSRVEILEIVRGIRRDTSLARVAISGGEPLLRPDLPELAGDLVREGLSVVVITNGTLLTPARLRRFPADTVFELTLFSYCSDTHDQMAGARAFDRVIEAAALIDRLGHHLVVALVISRPNHRHLFKTIELGIALGASGFLFNRVNLSRGAFPQAEELIPTAEMLRVSLGDADRAAAEYKAPIAVSVPIPPCVADPVHFPNLHFGWCPRGGSQSYFTVGATGLLRPCNHSSLVLGDLRTTSFREIVAEDSATGFWPSLPPECEACDHPLKEDCLGGCPAAAAECLGSTRRRDPFVDLALAQG